MKKRMAIAALVCCGAMIFTAVGCNGNKSTVKPASNSGSTEAATTERIIQTAQIGEPAELKKVEFTVNNLYKSEYYGSDGGSITNIIFVDVTVTNRTEETIDANMLTSFEFYVDGEYYDSGTLLSISSAKKQYGDEVNLFTDSIKPGETVTGVVPAELPATYGEAELFCLPLGGSRENYDPSTAITYSFNRYDYTELLRPESTEEDKAEEDDGEKKDNKSED